MIAICLYAVAYTADIIRGGLESVPHAQVEAARCMNLTRWQTTTQIVLPQAWPVILPPALAFAVSFIKDTALVSQIGVFELTFRARELNNAGYPGRARLRHGGLRLLPHVLPAQPAGPAPGDPPCHTSRSATARARYGALEVLKGVSLSIEQG